MSSKYVRDTVEQWLTDVSMSVPYYQTVNREENPSDDIWCTADFSSSLRDTLTYCGNTTSEEGEVEVAYRGRAGLGADPLLLALEADMIIFMAQRDVLGKLVIMQRSAPFETSGGSADKQYGLSIFLDYIFYE